jgi:lipid-binding SYLF domain-containing protein
MATLTLTSAIVAAQSQPGTREERERAQQAAEVLDSIMGAPDQEIPAGLLAKAHGIAVIPNVVKGAFLAGGRFGKGLVAARNERGEWGTPLYVDIGGGSFGLQIGVEATDLILVFTRPDGLREMLKDNLKLGADAGAVAGPVGRRVEAGTNLTFDSPIYSYSRNKGVFAGVSLDGSVLSVDDSSNQEVYGKGVSGTDILITKAVPVNDVTRPFREALKRHTPRKATE